RSLWKNGEYLARMVTDPMAEGPVSMRIQPVHPRRLASPAQQAGNPNVFAGIEFDALTRPTRYWIADARIDGQNISATYDPWPADLVIHEFIIEEEDQARGIPWFNTGLQPSADLRDYDDQVQDAARQIADQCGILYTESLDVPPAQVASAIKVQRRTIKAAPPGWKPFVYPAAQPAVQYPDYRAERQRELVRPVGMPLMMIRLDCARYNYSSARLETQNYYRAVAGFQQWMSGSQRSTGTLNRLVDEVARESRFSVPALRRRPPRVRYQWTWPPRPHVDPSKESDAEKTALDTRTLTLTDALAARGRDLETQVAMLSRERDLLTQAGLPLPSWMREEPTPAAQPANAQPSKTPPTRADLDAIEDRITSLEAEPHG
ncbi:MAG: phage portal protein, partial [Phycisphaerae bacterium]|nr:phage portal protein [Phycisphaerae bacterium]